ncbi:Transcription factor GAMYB [Acorus calamus]|uniref:Transcription factor GAMYB n=1 Tax=Acorus calamus TaxID=4465 RepID=A0AAV9FKW6_ACOCL|nr:Transcription factor GAMYB [Acorus calamus]
MDDGGRRHFEGVHECPWPKGLEKVPGNSGLDKYGKTWKSCRLRWLNHLRPDLRKGPFSAEEELRITQLQGLYGNKWAKIALEMPAPSSTSPQSGGSQFNFSAVDDDELPVLLDIKPPMSPLAKSLLKDSRDTWTTTTENLSVTVAVDVVGGFLKFHEDLKKKRCMDTWTTTTEKLCVSTEATKDPCTSVAPPIMSSNSIEHPSQTSTSTETKNKNGWIREVLDGDDGLSAEDCLAIIRKIEEDHGLPPFSDDYVYICGHWEGLFIGGDACRPGSAIPPSFDEASQSILVSVCS